MKLTDDEKQDILRKLKIDRTTLPSGGDGIYIGKAQVGEITSPTKSPILDRVIALARVNVGYAEIGTEVEVGLLDGEQKRLSAKVVKFPHFDPDKRRIRGEY